MEINRNAPATADGELRIDADPQTVFAVIAAIDQWPSWNPDVKSVTVEGPVQPGTVFRWKAGPSTLTSTLQVIDPPTEIAWTGTTMGIKAVHVFRFQPSDGGTLARSEESWEGPLASLLRGYSRRTLDKGIRSVLAHLKVEAERRGREGVSGLRGVTLTVRFLCELAMLAALAYWGFTVGDGAGAWALGVGAPLLAAIVWGAWVAPKARWPVPILSRVAIELVLFGAAVGALAVAGQPLAAVAPGRRCSSPRCSTPPRSAGRATGHPFPRLALSVPVPSCVLLCSSG